jgi:ubiquinone/menaquinone biosynthesis C-methylase UbiE
MEKKLKSSYDKLAEHYAKDVDTKSFNAYYERPAMINAIGNVKGLRALDAGCGAGFYTEWLINNGAKEAVAIDFSEKMVESTKKRIGDKAKVYVSNLNEKLNLEDNYFDLIISSLTLHYVKDLDFTLKELSRILKPNGKLIFSIHHPIMTYLYFSLENYFKEVLLEDVINKIPVYFYHRSFDSISNSLFNNNFLIERIIEPKPIKKFKEQDEKNYKKLNKKPHFIIFKTIKRI